MQIIDKPINDIIPYEKNPHYCDVIIERRQEFTGLKAVKLE